MKLETRTRQRGKRWKVAAALIAETEEESRLLATLLIDCEKFPTPIKGWLKRSGGKLHIELWDAAQEHSDSIKRGHALLKGD